jgi:hypothetical protein
VDEHLQLRLTPSSSPLSAAFCFLDCLVDTISYYNYYVEKQKKVKVTKKKPEKKRREEISCADMHAPSENKEHTHTYILEVSKIAVRPLECETLVCVRVCVGGGGGGYLCACAHTRNTTALHAEMSSPNDIAPPLIPFSFFLLYYALTNAPHPHTPSSLKGARDSIGDVRRFQLRVPLGVSFIQHTAQLLLCALLLNEVDDRQLVVHEGRHNHISPQHGHPKEEGVPPDARP